MARSPSLVLFRLHTSPRLGLAVLTAFLCYGTSGCLSNRYTISQQELARLAQLPPETRGDRVYVVQEMGERRNDPVESAPLATSQDDRDSAIEMGLDLGIMVTPGPGAPPGGGHHGGWHPGGGSPSGGRVSAPPPSRQAPPPSRPHGGSGHSFSGGGGDGGTDALTGAVVAAVVIIVAVVVLSAVGLAVNEGVRYDGAVKMYAEQPVHLKDAQGNESVVPLSQLVPAHANQAVSAEIMDDEGWGLRMVGRRPLDRKGAAFKLDMGSVQAFCKTCYSAAGFAANVQLGYFPHHRAGLLATASLGGGTNALGKSFQRHTIGLEGQWFPLSLWRFHLGAFGHGGWQIGREEDSMTRTGPAFGGGAILEIALTTRLALMARADWTTANNAPEGGWASTRLFTGGLAIY